MHVALRTVGARLRVTVAGSCAWCARVGHAMVMAMRALHLTTFMTLTPYALVLGASVSLSACGGSTAAAGGPHPSSAFADSDAKLFDDGVDFVADPTALADRWADDWNLEMNERIERSDVIALATVSTLRADVDPQKHTTYRLVAEPSETLKGKAPSEITLLSPEGTIGFSSVDRDKQRVLEDQFVVFIKWYKRPEGQVDAHFHLSVAAEKILAHVRGRVDSGRPKHTTIIEVHQTP